MTCTATTPRKSPRFAPPSRSLAGKSKACLTCGARTKKKLVQWEVLGVLYETAPFCNDKCLMIPLLADRKVGLSPQQFLMLFGGTPEDYVQVCDLAREQWRSGGPRVWKASALPGSSASLGSVHEGFRSLS